MERGWAQDVSEIYRNGDVYMDYTGRILTINVPIKFNKILVKKNKTFLEFSLKICINVYKFSSTTITTLN